MRKRKADERRNTLIALGLLALIILIFAVLVVRPGAILPMTNASYGSSVGAAATGGGGSCGPRAQSDDLVCRVETDIGSGAGATMLLSKGTRGCWTARWPKGQKPPVSGCVDLLDLIHPNESGNAY